MVLLASEHTLRYKGQATCFNEALPLGNGRIGAMVYGGVLEEKISLNEDTFWSGYPKEKNVEDYPSVYRKALSLFEGGKIAEAQTHLEGNFGDHLVQMYLPLADLKIQMKHVKEDVASQYSRMLKLNRAVHSVSYVMGRKRYMRECFVSEPYQVMAVRLSCSEKDSISFCTTLESRFPSRCHESKVENVFFICGTAPNGVAEYGDFYRSTDNQVLDGKGVSYACAVGVQAEGGTVTCDGDSVRVEGADEAVIYFGVRTNFKGYDTFPCGEGYKELCLFDVKRALELSYEVLKKESVRSHKKLYNRCQISFGEGIKTRIPTDVRLRRLQEGHEDNGLYALLFNFGKYLTIAGSRHGTQAMNLQGIWNDKLIPPWNSNYTLNINTEMNYWPTLGMGLFECYEPFVRFVEELSKSGKQTARDYYGIDGWVCHHSSDIWRLTHPGTNRLQGNAQWGFWNMASGWLSVMLWNYYRYTLDETYLERIYPVMNGAARFYRELLVECDGELIVPLSTSPENNYVDEFDVHALDKSTAMTQEILYDLFAAVSEASKVLGVDDVYGELVPKLKRPFVQKNGELCEWHSEHGVWDIHHRHVSHLYGLFPSDQFAGDRERSEACCKVLESRGDGGTGWSLAWKINLWAKLGDGEHALRLLKRQMQLVAAKEEGHDGGGGSYPNLFCAHPPFQIDGNFGAASGIMEMLVQCDTDGNVMLLPALPKSWSKGKVENLHLPGNRTLSFAWEEGKILWRRIDEKKK